MLSGVPDLFLPVPKKGFHGLFIEMKSQQGRVSVSQSRFYLLRMNWVINLLCVIRAKTLSKNQGIFKNVTHVC